MKNYIFIFVLFIALSGYSQSSHFALNMGAAVPLGDFASNGDFLTNGYAKPGFNLSFDGNYIPTWYFGFGGTLNFSNFDMDHETLKDDYLAFIDPTLPNLPEDAEIILGVGHWNYVNILFGPTLALPTDYVQFNIKALFGASIIVPPGGSIEVNSGDQHYYTYSSGQTVSFGYQFGADIIYEMASNYSLMLGGSYFGSKAKYDVNTDFGEVLAGEPVDAAVKDVKLSAVQITLGLAFLF